MRLLSLPSCTNISRMVESLLKIYRCTIFLLCLILFSSCEKKNEAIALVAPNGGEISIVKGEESLFLTLDSVAIERVEELSGEDVSDALKDLVPDMTIYKSSYEQYSGREELVTLLMSQSDKDRIDVISNNKKVLEKSELLSKMDSFSSGYDSAILKQVCNVDNTYQYELSSILIDAKKWEDAVAFFSEWKKAILR